MTAFRPEEVRTMLTVAGLTVDDWDADQLAEMLTGQWAEIDSVRDQLDQSDEPALRFDPRWQ
jgi:hypothetical protein